MKLIEIEERSCNQDGLCAAICPAGLISFEKGTFPEEIDGAEGLCIRCGHCLAVCPTASLRHRDIDIAECAPVQEDLKLAPDQSAQFLKGRRSIRTYRKKQVAQETLAQLLDIARYAPSGHNTQGVKWLVLTREEELRQLAGIVVDWMRYVIETMPEFAKGMHMERTVGRWEEGVDVILRSAPALLIAYGDKDSRLGPSSCTIALTYLELAATGQGLGGCWAGYFTAAASSFPPMKKALALGDEQQVFGAMMVGYPKFAYQRIPQRQSLDITWRL